MASPIGPTTPILCPAGTWTTVCYGLITTGNYMFVANVPGITVSWQRFTSSPPWYWSGSFTSGGATNFIFPPWLISDLQFNPASALTITRF
jgi:hypothetical protein